MAQDRAVLAGGCFWGMEGLIRDLDGVGRGMDGWDQRDARLLGRLLGEQIRHGLGRRMGHGQPKLYNTTFPKF